MRTDKELHSVIKLHVLALDEQEAHQVVRDLFRRLSAEIGHVERDTHRLGEWKVVVNTLDPSWVRGDATGNVYVAVVRNVLRGLGIPEDAVTIENHGHMAEAFVSDELRQALSPKVTWLLIEAWDNYDSPVDLEVEDLEDEGPEFSEDYTEEDHNLLIREMVQEFRKHMEVRLVLDLAGHNLLTARQSVDDFTHQFEFEEKQRVTQEYEELPTGVLRVSFLLGYTNPDIEIPGVLQATIKHFSDHSEKLREGWAVTHGSKEHHAVWTNKNPATADIAQISIQIIDEWEDDDEPQGGE